jgi:GntR family transcriptional regulator
MVMNREWHIDFSSGVPVYKQIINHVHAAIGNGDLNEGDRLPTIKEVAGQLNVNPNTVAKAYRELDLKGVITGRRGNGSFVSAAKKTPPGLTAREKKSILNRLFGRLITEARGEGIMENELMAYFFERMKADEKA